MVSDYRKALALQKDKLHPLLAETCHGQFIRAEFDSAVFEAYKTLEVRIREAAKRTPRVQRRPSSHRVAILNRSSA